MKIFKKISEMIEEELEGAEHYAECALRQKESNPTLAKTFYDISLEEVKHIGMLHGEVKKLIEAHRHEKGDPPPAMLAVYEYLHEKHIQKTAKIKMLQAEYRGIQ